MSDDKDNNETKVKGHYIHRNGKDVWIPEHEMKENENVRERHEHRLNEEIEGLKDQEENKETDNKYDNRERGKKDNNIKLSLNSSLFT